MNDNPTRVLLFRSFLAAISLIWICGPVRAQVTGIEVVVDTAFYGANTPTPEDTFDPEGELDGYVSYLVYVNYTNPTDVLSAIFADTFALPEGGAMVIDADCGCYNPIDDSMVMSATNSSFFWAVFPMYEYDTFWTIGKASADAPGNNPQWVSNPAVGGDEICGCLLYTSPSPRDLSTSRMPSSA